MQADKHGLGGQFGIGFEVENPNGNGRGSKECQAEGERCKNIKPRYPRRFFGVEFINDIADFKLGLRGCKAKSFIVSCEKVIDYYADG